MNKLYRVTRPILEKYEHIFSGYQIKGNPLDLTFENDKYTFTRKEESNVSFRVGDTVDMDTIAKWVEIGLQPLFFTEEVLEVCVDADQYNGYYDYEYYSNSDLNEQVRHKEMNQLPLETENFHLHDRNDSLEYLISSGTFIDEGDLKGFFISKHYIDEEQEELINEVKKWFNHKYGQEEEERKGEETND